MKASLPHNEPQRLTALRRYNVLDTAPEDIFDGITRLISYICDTPIAVINLLDEGRQWFKSEIGLGVRQTPLDISICAHAILQPGIFIVPDTMKDARFTDNPLVLAQGGLRFYAGALLKSSDGYSLGTLCVLDRKPRILTTAQQDSLQTLANAVMELLELRRANYEQLKIAHDFMNLATGIRGMATLLLDEETISAANKTDLQAILHAAERATELSRQIKKSEKVSVVSSLLHVNKAVTETVEMVRRFLREDLTISTQLSEEDPVIRLDQTPLEQIILNLILNARDATPGKGAITLSTKVEKSVLHLSVQDTGAGIPDDVLPHIFDRFYTTKKEGTGLGLASIREILQAHGGSIAVDSKVGAGTTFRVMLPVVKQIELTPVYPNA